LLARIPSPQGYEPDPALSSIAGEKAFQNASASNARARPPGLTRLPVWNGASIAAILVANYAELKLMTELLEKAIAEIRKLPPVRQNEAAEMLLEMASQDASEYRLSAEQIADLEARLAGPPDYATDEEVERLFERLTE
jgi:hypothetical protein